MTEEQDKQLQTQSLELEKKAEKIGVRDKSGADERPVRYKTKTWWGVLIAVFLLFLLNWGVRAKHGWVRINVANFNVALLAVVFAYIFLRVLKVRSKVILSNMWGF